MTRSLVAVAALVGAGLGWVAPAASTTAASTTAASTGVAGPPLSRIGGPMIPASSTAGPTAGPAGLPMVSQNWSGYAATANTTFTAVHGQFVEPTLTCTGAPYRWTSDWVGLDGFTNLTVEQDGTFAYCGGPQSRTPQYYAWYEMYPAGSVELFPVNAGDLIDASVTYRGGQFVLTVADLSAGRSATKHATCTVCQRASAEWIVERPVLANFFEQFLTALADFHRSTISGDVARVAGAATAHPFTWFASHPIDMIQDIARGFISLDQTGPFERPTYGFTVTWDRAGTPTPVDLAGPGRHDTRPVA